MVEEPAASRTWRPGRPVDLLATLSPLRRGGQDPTFRVDGARCVWRTSRTPDGLASQRVVVDPTEGTIICDAWGPGAGWLCDTLPALLGDADDVDGFDPAHPLLRETWRRHRGWRVPASSRVLEALVPGILEQKVTGMEARRSWRRLLLAYGEPAPGPVAESMSVVPDPAGWARIPSWEWHRAGVGPERSAAIVRSARVAESLERTVGRPMPEVERALRTVPGVGAWTAAEVRQRAHGDADAVSVGDFHIAKNTCFALTGEIGDDARMLELLEPYAGHRYRVIRMVELSRVEAPRRGPRYAPLDHRGR